MAAKLKEKRTSNQCCGSGSTGSTCFWASRIRILLSSCKNSEKNLDSYYFVTLFDFLSLKNGVSVASKSNKQKKIVLKKLVFCWHLEGQWRKSQDPDPLVRGMDPRIRIHPKMSWIRNTASNRLSPWSETNSYHLPPSPSLLCLIGQLP